MTDARQPSRTSFVLRDPLPWSAFSALAREGESLGYEGVFLPEIGGRDTLVTLGALAGETDRIRLGTGIVPMSSRSVVLAAMAAATVQERSGGRLILGLGTGSALPGALDRLASTIGSLRPLLAGEEVEIDGIRRRLSLVPDDPVPIWIAALGPRAVRLAGELADGVILNWCTPERVEAARAELAQGAERAGRDPHEVTVAVYVRGCFDDEEPASSSALRTAAAEYASYPAYARQFASMGLDADAPQDLVRAICLTGDPDDARARLDRFRAAGADLPVVYPVATGARPVGSVRSTLRLLAPAT